MAVNLSIISFNCKGHSDDRIDYINQLVAAYDIILIQEHWYNDYDLPSLACRIRNVQVFGSSGMETSELLIGRPYGGCAILLSDRLNYTFTPISVSKRCYAGILELPNNVKVLIYNIYMPCDTNHDHNNNEEYACVLAEFINVCNNHTDVNYTVLAGDFNTDLSRVNALHTRELLNFMNGNSMAACIRQGCSDVKHTYENIHTGVLSTLDHFLISENLLQYVLEYRSIHEGESLSDHCPVLLRLSLDTVHVSLSNDKQYVPKPSWRKASHQNISDYQSVLSSILDTVHVPLNVLQCKDFHCSIHYDDIDMYYNNLVNACITATDRCIPHTRRRGRAGWNEYVRSNRSDSMFWHNIWLQCGRPQCGIVANIRRTTRAKYHRAVKELKSQENLIRAGKMANAFISQNRQDFWDEVKRIDNNKCNTVPKVVDGKQNDTDISNVFADKYQQLYNCVSYDQGEMNSVFKALDASIDSLCNKGGCYDSHIISSHDVANAIGKLKLNKSDGVHILLSDSLKHSNPLFHEHLSVLFTAMLYHGFAPHSMKLSTIIPIPKNRKKCLNDSNNCTKESYWKIC